MLVTRGLTAPTRFNPLSAKHVEKMAGRLLRKFLPIHSLHRLQKSILGAEHTTKNLWSFLEPSKYVTAAQQVINRLCLGFLHPAVPELPHSPMGDLELPWDGVMWAVPKKRTSYTRKRIRNAPKHLKPRSDYIMCPQCKNLKLIHVLCGHCLKETLRKTAEMRTAEVELKLQNLAQKAKELIK